MTKDTLPQAPLVPGALLVAAPHMQDENFMHTVIQLCAVEDVGSMGFVLNHSSGFVAGDLLSGHPGLEDCSEPVFTGGPVGKDQVHFLHRDPGAIQGGAPIMQDLWLGGEFEDLADCLRQPPGRGGKLRLFVGYSGWGPGQLEHELGEDAWLVLEGQSRAAFECAQLSREEYWRAILRAQGPAGQYLAQLPPDPSWN